MKAEAALTALRRVYVDAINARDLDGLMALHTETTVHMPPGMPPLVGRADLRSLMAQSLAAMPGGFAFDFRPHEVRITKNWAVERGVTPAPAPFPSGKYVILYERESDGEWRIAWTIANNDLMAAAR